MNKLVNVELLADAPLIERSWDVHVVEGLSDELRELVLPNPTYYESISVIFWVVEVPQFSYDSVP